MNSNYNTIARWARMAVPALAVMALAGCMADDDPAPDPSAPATLQLRLVAEQEGDLNETRATEAGTDGEYMSDEICVLIVNAENVIVKKFLTTDELQSNPDAQAGNMEEWTSDPFTLAPGVYNVYAFANWSTADNTQLNSFVGIGEGADLDELQGVDIRNIVLEDLTAKLNFNDSNIDARRFIPMSADTSVTITSATRGIDIGLDRLVSKVRATVNLSAFTGQTVQLGNLVFSGIADRVGLFKGQQVSGVQRNISYTVDLSALQPQPENEATYSVPDFYVNATEDDASSFTVRLSTDQYNGTVYEARTARTDLPRNAIYPINLSFNNYVPVLEMHAWLSPIGSFPVSVAVQWDDSYVVEVPEGCQFSFSAAGLAGEGLENVTCQWNIPEEAQNVAAIETGSNETTVKGHVTAQAGLQFPLQLYIQWDEGDRHYARTYPITVQVKDMFSFRWLNAPSVGYMRQLFPESVQILIKK